MALRLRSSSRIRPVVIVEVFCARYALLAAAISAASRVVDGVGKRGAGAAAYTGPARTFHRDKQRR